MPSSAVVRQAEPGELPEVESVLRAAGFSSQVGALLQMPHRSAHGRVFVVGDGGLDAVAAAISFPEGHSGWIGAVGVRPSTRRRGLGAAVTEAAVEWLGTERAHTISLYATREGQPIYERLGFTPESKIVAWRGTSPRRPETFAGLSFRPLTESDRDAVCSLDTAATGEVRATAISAISPLSGTGCIDRSGSLSGFALSNPWGSASAVIARDSESGVALMAAETAVSGGTLIVPEANVSAAAAVRSWQLGRLNSATRMHLGPKLEWRPEQQFGTFNLFWG